MEGIRMWTPHLRGRVRIALAGRSDYFSVEWKTENVSAPAVRGGVCPIFD